MSYQGQTPMGDGDFDDGFFIDLPFDDLHLSLSPPPATPPSFESALPSTPTGSGHLWGEHASPNWSSVKFPTPATPRPSNRPIQHVPLTPGYQALFDSYITQPSGPPHAPALPPNAQATGTALTNNASNQAPLTATTATTNVPVQVVQATPQAQASTGSASAILAGPSSVPQQSVAVTVATGGDAEEHDSDDSSDDQDELEESPAASASASTSKRKRCDSDASSNGQSAMVAREFKKLRSISSESGTSSSGASSASTPPTTPEADGGESSGSHAASPAPSTSSVELNAAEEVPPEGDASALGDDQEQNPAVPAESSAGAANAPNSDDEAAEARRKAKGKGRARYDDEDDTPEETIEQPCDDEDVATSFLSARGPNTREQQYTAEQHISTAGASTSSSSQSTLDAQIDAPVGTLGEGSPSNTPAALSAQVPPPSHTVQSQPAPHGQQQAVHGSSTGQVAHQQATAPISFMYYHPQHNANHAAGHPVPAQPQVNHGVPAYGYPPLPYFMTPGGAVFYNNFPAPPAMPFPVGGHQMVGGPFTGQHQLPPHAPQHNGPTFSLYPPVHLVPVNPQIVGSPFPPPAHAPQPNGAPQLLAFMNNQAGAPAGAVPLNGQQPIQPVAHPHGGPLMQGNVASHQNTPGIQLHQQAAPIALHIQNGGHQGQQVNQQAPHAGPPPAQPTVAAPNIAPPANGPPAAAGNGVNGPAQNVVHPIGLEASTQGASSNPDLHTCGWLVTLGKMGKCGASIANDKASIRTHLQQWHSSDVDLHSSGRQACGWAKGPNLGSAERCKHSPACCNLHRSIYDTHMGPHAKERVCDYPTCFVPTGRGRRCPAHINATW